MTPWPDGTELLERAIGYALGALADVAVPALGRPTPCRGWDLRTLLRHLDASLGALREGVERGRVTPEPTCEASGDVADPVPGVRERAARLLAAATAAQRSAGGAPRAASRGARPLALGAVTSAGALEIAVHGWDVHRARGRLDRPVPGALAVELLRLAPLLVPPGSSARAPLFAAVRAVPLSASPGERLLAYLGRDPRVPPAHP
ncbi:maleylpyruvate isomerase family mycothiol-dependent enzyme [Streptomyces chumphonensis]|uniref:TIGR03086 family protein n=1 Tax=Streptomyces chumphonensis TaxID=1214925 RepID=A0A927F3D8_9ACTN|nr:TIGR03086 family metal-binding protein [Streptomyces chumphonensis]MBD3934493.1 TIGR03086 family protein [Streptomyces chumphonensis]